MKKKSTLFALIAVACIAVALYFMYRETRETFDVGYDETEPEQEVEPEPEQSQVTETATDNGETS